MEMRMGFLRSIACWVAAFALATTFSARADTHPQPLSDTGTPDAVDNSPAIPLPPAKASPRVQQENGKPIFSVFNDGMVKGLEQYEQWLGRPSDGILRYSGDRDWADYQGSIGWAAGVFKNVDRRPLYSVAFMPKKGTTLAAAAKGAYNDQWKKAAETILAKTPTNQPIIYIRTAWEFNGNWFHYNAVKKEQDFIGAWRQFVSTFRSVSDRFRFDWCPGGTVKLSMKAEDAYPGDDYVDIIGLDVYDQNKWPIFNDPVERWNKVIVNGDHGLAWLKQFADAHNKPMSIPEWGACSDKAGDNPYFIEQMYTWMVENHVIYASYWNSDATYKGKLSGDRYPKAGAKYKELFGATDIANPAPPAAAATPPPAAAATPAPATVETAATVPAASSGPAVACTITAAAPLEAFGPDGSMTGVSQSVVGQSYQCLRVEGTKAVLQDASGKIFKIRADAVSQTPKAAGASGT